MIRVLASHCFAVSKLRDLPRSRERQSTLTCATSPTQNSLGNRWRRAPATSPLRAYLPRGELRAQGIKACREWLDPREDRVINFVTREMGLMVKRGNPLKITSLKDLVKRKARFVNRDHDSGTRLLFDQLLALHKIPKTGSTAPSTWSSPMPRSPPMSRAAWRMRASASRPRRGGSASISSAFSRRTISSSASARSSRPSRCSACSTS